MSLSRTAPRTYTFNDEKLYLEHVVADNGKEISVAHRVEGIAVLKTWLKTWNRRRWDFAGVERLVPIAEKNLAKLLAA